MAIASRASFLLGMTARNWWRVLRDNRFAIEARYRACAAYVSARSVLNSILAAREERRYGAAIRATDLVEPPLFVLGYWRAGTTLLFNLLSEDRDCFTAPTTFEVMNPHTFLLTEEPFLRRFGARRHKRGFDDMIVGLDTPQEDEFALAVMSGLSSYLAVPFPKHRADYVRYNTTEGMTLREREVWRDVLLLFLKKLTLRRPRRLLLKSPPHTGRLGELSTMFAGARFVHISRHPYDLVRSRLHLLRTLIDERSLQGLPEDDDIDFVLADLSKIYDAFFHRRTSLAAGQLYELRYEDLVADTLGELRRLYEALGLPAFDRVEPQVGAYVDSLQGYRRNRFPALAPEIKARVADRWRRYFDEYGYQP